MRPLNRFDKSDIVMLAEDFISFMKNKKNFNTSQPIMK